MILQKHPHMRRQSGRLNKDERLLKMDSVKSIKRIHKERISNAGLGDRPAPVANSLITASISSAVTSTLSKSIF